MTDLNQLIEAIREWALIRGLNEQDPFKQLAKLTEETGELASAMLKMHAVEIEDGIGDIFVVLVVLSMQLGLSLELCVEQAYFEIKNRSGTTVNGTFIKTQDLERKRE